MDIIRVKRLSDNAVLPTKSMTMTQDGIYMHLKVSRLCQIVEHLLEPACLWLSHQGL